MSPSPERDPKGGWKVDTLSHRRHRDAHTRYRAEACLQTAVSGQRYPPRVSIPCLRKASVTRTPRNDRPRDS